MHKNVFLTPQFTLQKNTKEPRLETNFLQLKKLFSILFTSQRKVSGTVGGKKHVRQVNYKPKVSAFENYSNSCDLKLNIFSEDRATRIVCSL